MQHCHLLTLFGAAGKKDTQLGVEHSSAGSAPAPCVEATVLVAGDPGSNPEPSGLILRVIPPLSASYFLSISTVLYIKGKKSPKKYTLKKKKLYISMHVICNLCTVISILHFFIVCL